MTGENDRFADLTQLLDSARRISADPLAEDAAAVDAAASWPHRGLAALQHAGLTGLVAPRSSGGLGQGLYGLARVCAILAEGCGSTAMCFAMHCVATAVIAAKATPIQRERFLVPIAAGRHLTTLALSEPGTGAHFYLPETRLERVDAQAYRISGRKSFVTNGGKAHSYVVSVVSVGDDSPPGHFSCLVVPAETDGLTWTDKWRGMGMRGNSSDSLEIERAVVPADSLLGAEGDQIWYVFHVVAPYFLIAMAGTYLGLADAAFAEARRHLLARAHTSSSGRLAEIPVLQHRLGALWAALERTRTLVHDAARRYDAGDPDAATAIMAAKVEASDAAVTVANEALTLCGGIAYREDAKLHRILRDARAAHVMSPTSELLRLWMGRTLLGQPLLGA